MLMATAFKMTLTLTAFAGSPLVDITVPTEVLFSRIMDVVWMLLAAVVPLFVALVQRHHSPPCRITIQLRGFSKFDQRRRAIELKSEVEAGVAAIPSPV